MARTGGSSLSRLAYERLRSEIVTLGRPPGQRLLERELAEELAISRIPLREALRLLEAEGLVVIVPRQGAMVATFTAADVRHLFDVRESMEVLAARLAAQSPDSRGLAAAQRELLAGREALAQSDAAASASASAGFHECVIAMSGNPLLQSMMQPVNTRVRWLFHLTFTDELNSLQCIEHEEMYHAIASGNADLAAQLAFDHVHSSRDDALAMAAGWTVADIDPIEATKSRQRERRQ